MRYPPDPTPNYTNNQCFNNPAYRTVNREPHATNQSPVYEIASNPENNDYEPVYEFNDEDIINQVDQLLYEAPQASAGRQASAGTQAYAEPRPAQSPTDQFLYQAQDDPYSEAYLNVSSSP